MVLGSAPASAQTPAGTGEKQTEADQLFEQARALMAEGRYAEACPKLEGSQARDPGIGTEFNLARCYELQARLASALAMYRRVVAESHAAGQGDREAMARNLAADVEARVPNLLLQIDSPETDMQVKLDGVVLPSSQWQTRVPVDPGAHEIDVTAPERMPWKTVVRVEREHDTVSLYVPALVPKAALQPVARLPLSFPPGPGAREGASHVGTQRVIALALGAAGLSGTIPGTILGLRAMSLESQAVPLCPQNQCSRPGYDDRSTSRTYGDASTVTFVVSGALLAAAGILWFTAPSHR
jgi:hypothetical protein